MLVAPVIPGLNDEEIPRILEAAAERASILDQLFHNARRQHDLARGGPTLCTDAFRRLPGGHRSLF